MWVIARRRHDGSQVCRSDATGLLRAVQRLSHWAENIAARAVPDPDQ